jgi:hypothetical protein
MQGFVLPRELADELCHRLEVPWPSGPDDLTPLYRAWCAAVPFDNVSKGLALTEGREPPGDDPVAVVDRYLRTGLGGTCWAHVSALGGLLEAAGADVTVGLDRMHRDDGVVADFHSFVIVHDGGRAWLLDPVWVSGRPLPLVAGARGDHAVIGAGLDADGHRLQHWGSAPWMSGRRRYALLSTVLDRDDVRAWCAISARFSGVPVTSLSFRRTTATGTETLRVHEDGSGLLYVRRRRSEGHRDETFTDPDAAFAALGCTPEARRIAERAGLLGGAG